MSGVRRWLRLDVTWSSSEWLVELRPGGRLAWVELLGYVKANGAGGRAKAMSAKAAGKRWGIPVRDVQAMLDAAHGDAALRTEDGDWIVTGWATYQEVDATAAERMRRHRAGKPGKTSPPDPSRRNDRNLPRNPSRDSDVDVDVDPEKGTSTAAAGRRAGGSTPTANGGHPLTLTGLALEAAEVLGLGTWGGEADPKIAETRSIIRRRWHGQGVKLETVRTAIRGLRALVDRGEISWLADRQGKPIDGIEVLTKNAVVGGDDGDQLTSLFAVAERTGRELELASAGPPRRVARGGGVTRVAVELQGPGVGA